MNQILFNKFIRYVCCLLLITFSSISLSKGLGQKVTLDPLVVTSEVDVGSLTSPSIVEAREELKRIPGSIGFVDPEEYLHTRLTS